MNAHVIRRGTPAVVLWGALGALAWTAIVVFAGGSSASADEHDQPGLLGSVTSIVSDTTDAVGDTVTAVTGTVSAVVQPVVTVLVPAPAPPAPAPAPAPPAPAPAAPAPPAPAPAAPAPPAPAPLAASIQPAATTPPAPAGSEHPATTASAGDAPAQTHPDAPGAVSSGHSTASLVPAVLGSVSHTVSGVGNAVTAPVVGLLTSDPASTLLTPVRDTVGALPLVGDLVRSLGLFTVIDGVIGIVDDATGTIGGLIPSIPAIPEIPVIPVLPGTTPGGADPDPSPATESPRPPGAVVASSVDPPPSALAAPLPSSRTAVSSSAGTFSLASSPVAAPAAADARTDQPAPSTGWSVSFGVLTAPTSSASSTGTASTGSVATTEGHGLISLSITRTAGASDDALPASPISGTDSSPD